MSTAAKVDAAKVDVAKVDVAKVAEAKVDKKEQTPSKGQMATCIG
jgi:hypothetical protein